MPPDSCRENEAGSVGAASLHLAWQLIVTKFICGLLLNFSYSFSLMETKMSARIPSDVEIPCKGTQAIHGHSRLSSTASLPCGPLLTTTIAIMTLGAL